MTPHRVLIVDDQQLMLHALRVFVSGAPDLQVVGEAMNGAAAVTQAAALEPDVVLMDVQMPVMDGIDATRRITETQPDVRVIAVTTFGTPASVVPALRAGASGYLLKDVDPEVLLTSIRKVLRGQAVISPALVGALVDAIRDQPSALAGDGERVGATLTGRETEVLDLLAQGMSNQEMARELGLSEGAVKSRLSQLTVKLGVNSRVQILVRACELGLVRPRLRRPR